MKKLNEETAMIVKKTIYDTQHISTVDFAS